jgi:hypothetical protein
MKGWWPAARCQTTQDNEEHVQARFPHLHQL